MTYTNLTTEGDKKDADLSGSIKMVHNYVDGSYTYGPSWLITGGLGIGVSGTADVTLTAPAAASTSTSDFSAWSFWVGPGYAIGWFDIYWLYRRNYVRYKADGGDVNANLQHYQLGLGVNF